MNRVIVLVPVLLLVAGVYAQNVPRLAVVEFSTNIVNDKTKADAITVRNLVENQIVKTRKYQIITSDEIDNLLANQRIQAGAISSSENIKKLQLQNISYIVTGSLDVMGTDYAITIKVLDVSTGRFSHSDSDFIGGGSRELYTGINELTAKVIAGMTAAVPSAVTYKIGDRGPAGGWIFYDKGIFSDGWRYLEAAPGETEFTGVEWGAYRKDISGTGNAIGSGKRNTELIVNYLKQTGENGRAVQLCVSLGFGGKNDWFLPSKDELDLMYKNLKQKGLEAFSGWYWSSSQIDFNYTWLQSFNDGRQYSYAKYNSLSVRAVRTF